MNIPNVAIHLHKQIPIGSGLGGGSADAAFTLKALNEIFHLDLDTKALELYAAQLGADCSFFIQNTPKYVEGIGDRLNSLNLKLDQYEIRLISSDIQISSTFAYNEVQLTRSNNNLKELIKQPLKLWRNNIMKDFEYSVFKKYPILLKNKNKLYQEGAIYSSLTGSGSTVYGIFQK